MIIQILLKIFSVEHLSEILQITQELENVHIDLVHKINV